MLSENQHSVLSAGPGTGPFRWWCCGTRKMGGLSFALSWGTLFGNQAKGKPELKIAVLGGCRSLQRPGDHLSGTHLGWVLEQPCCKWSGRTEATSKPTSKQSKAKQSKAKQITSSMETSKHASKQSSKTHINQQRNRQAATCKECKHTPAYERVCVSRSA